MVRLIPRLHDPANVRQLARVFWIHLLEVCWTFAGSCKHPIKIDTMLTGFHVADNKVWSTSPENTTMSPMCLAGAWQPPRRGTTVRLHID